jgi:hypothetical protein
MSLNPFKTDAGLAPNHGHSTQSPRKSPRRKLVASLLLFSLIAHGAVAFVATIIVVVRHFTPPPPVFTSAPPVRVPVQKTLERKAAANSLAALARPPVFQDKLLSSRPAPVSLPALPPLPGLAPGSFSLDSLASSALVDSAALASGIGTGTSSGSSVPGTGKGSTVQFMGVQTRTERIVLMFDISKTVANAAAQTGMPMESIRSETSKLLDSLGAQTRFGLVQFARNYAFFHTELLPASPKNRATAHHWLREHFATNGSFPSGVPNTVTGSPGFLAALGAAFQLKPDALFILSDFDLQQGPSRGTQITTDQIGTHLRDLQTSLPHPAKIHCLGIGVRPETERQLRKILASHGGGGRFSPLAH